MISQAPSLRLLTPLASLLLAVAAVAWVGVVVLARDMGSMPGTMGLGVVSFIAVWALMMAAMMLPSVTPFASLYMRTFGDDRGWRLAGFASGYLIVWIAGALPAYGLAWLAGRCGGSPGRGDGAGGSHLRRLRRLPAHPVEGPVPGPLPVPARFRAEAGRLPGPHSRPASGAVPWRLLPGLLLGPDGVAGCLRVDERDRHGGPGRLVLVEKTWVWGPRFSRLLGVAALGLALAVIFVPGLAPGLHQAPSPGGMGGM